MHNLAIILADPPIAHGEFKSMIHRLRKCCLAVSSENGIIVGMHNLAIVLADPPIAHEEFRSMIHGLRECCLASAVTVNIVVHQGIIRQFWKTAKLKRDNDGAFTIEADVKGCRMK